MMKIIKYFFQATLIYIYFIFIKLIGLKLARIFSSFLFNKIGPVIKSKDIIDENLDRFIGSYNDSKKNLSKQR